MPGNRYTVTNVFVGQVTLWVAAKGSPIPADSVPIDTDWSTLTTGGITAGMWRCPGATMEGWSTQEAATTNDINIEEQSTPALSMKASSTFRIVGTLAEDTLENIKLARGGGTLVVQAAASGVIGKKTLSGSDVLDQYAIGLEGLNSFGQWRRIYVPSATSVSNINAANRRAAAARTYAIQLNAQCAPSQIQIVDMTAVALP